MASNDRGGTLAYGVQTFAGIMLIVGGAFQIIQSIAVLFNDKYLLVLPNYVFAADLTVWGWIHLLLGLILLLVGIFLLRGATWARIAGIVVAAIAALINFSWLPYSTWWALLAIGVDILVIWALASGPRARVE
jgi:hypothetical protein